MFESSNCEFVEFRGLGQIDKAFVPLLDEVCADHPSIIQCHLQRSRAFTEQAFNALGRVLYFLKNKKIRDLNEQCYNELDALLNELKTFQFDLSWLEQHLHSIFSMKTYVEKAIEVERLKKALMYAEFNADTERDLLIARNFKV